MSFFHQDLDSLLKEVILLLQTSDYASSSLIQRRFSIGYARAARIIDQLYELGFVGAPDGSKPREILIKDIPEDFNLEKYLQDMALLKSTPTSEWKRVKEAMDGHILKLGKNKKKKIVTLDLEKYGNLILVGSELTGISKQTNKILNQLAEEKSPEELKLIVADPSSNQLKIKDGDPHLLTPVIDNPGKLVPALAWLSMEIDKRRKAESLEFNSPILLFINNFNEFNYYAPAEIQDRMSMIFKLGRNVKVYCIISFDYLDPSIRKDLFVSVGAKIVFKPTTEHMARNNGIPESIELTSPDEAILETMYEGRETFFI